MKRIWAASLILGWTALLNAAIPEIPLVMNFQGVFSSGPLTVNFYITGSASSVDRLPAGGAWTEQVSTSTTDGMISHLLGSVTPIPRSVFTSSSSTRYLEVSVDGESTFLDLVSVPNAFRASLANELAGGSTIQGTLNVSTRLDVNGIINGTQIYRNGAPFGEATQWDSISGGINFAGGNVGIGTTNTRQKLNVVDGGTNARILIENSANGGSSELNLLSRTAGGTEKFFNLFNSAGDRLGLWTTDSGEILTLKQNGSVGIGTIAPRATFNINGGDGTKPTFWVEGSSNVLFTNNGYIGIGTDKPIGQLHLFGSGEQEFAMTRSDLANRPTFRFGRIIPAGDGDPEFRFLYRDDATAERAILEFDKKGIIASVKTGVGSHFEGFFAGDGQPVFRLNSYPAMQLEFGPGGSSATDVAMRRAQANTLVFINQVADGTANERERVRIDANGNVGIGTNAPQSALQVSGYLQVDLTSGSPPAGDCDADAERGRMKFDSSNNLLYICRGTSGWTTK